MTFGILAIVLSICLLEVGCFVVSYTVPRSLFYIPPTREQFVHYLKGMSSPVNAEEGVSEAEIKFRAQVGWLPPPKEISPDGYRLSPSSKMYTKACISAYGDSFIYGDEVSSDAVWSDKLAQELGCRVDNYAVSGYGTDQSLLRFEQTRLIRHAM